MAKIDDASHAALSEAQELGHEARAGKGDHAVLKLWLRMLASTTQIEAEIRKRLRERFGISLARFDYMAASPGRSRNEATGGVKRIAGTTTIKKKGGGRNTVKLLSVSSDDARHA